MIRKLRWLSMGFCPKLLVSNSPIRKKLHPKSEETASKGGTLFLEVETPISTLHSPQASPFTGPSHICAGRVSEGYMQGFQWQSTAGRTLLAETWSEFRTLPEKLGKRMIKKCPFMKISYSMEIHWWKSQWNPMNLFSATGGLGGYVSTSLALFARITNPCQSSNKSLWS